MQYALNWSKENIHSWQKTMIENIMTYLEEELVYVTAWLTPDHQVLLDCLQKATKLMKLITKF